MKKFFSVLIKTFIILFIIVTLSGVVLYVSVGNPDLDTSKIVDFNVRYELYDAYDNKIDVQNGYKFINYDELPKNLIDAFVSIEDKKFFTHNGIDVKRMIGALFKDITTFSLSEGASTITQQLIKNTHLSNEKSLDRKIKEIKLAMALEEEWSKEQIFEAYVNVIYFGNNLYGVNAAAKAYFSKDVKDLSLEECALLAGVVKSPLNYSPLKNYDNALKRRNLVLSEMLKDGKISNEQYDISCGVPINLTKSNDIDFNLSSEIISEAADILKISDDEIINSDYKIYTEIDLSVQEKLINAINDSVIAPLTVSGDACDRIGIITNNRTGAIIAYCNSTYYPSSQLRRQPASTVKPFVSYMPALEKGLISPITQILDEKVTLNGYTPHNYKDKYYGWIDERTAVAKSLNVPAVLNMNYAGIDYSINYAKNFGLTFDERDYSLATALGGMTYGLTSRELTDAYMALANSGNYIDSHFVRKICDKNGNVVYENKKEFIKIAQEDTVYLMTDMLRSVVSDGTGMMLSVFDFDIAGKTGTNAFNDTSYSNDLYAVDYTSDNTFFVWYGNIDNTEEDAIDSVYYSAKSPTSVVKNVMETVYADKVPSPFVKPETVIELDIDGSILNDEHVVLLANEYSSEKSVLKSVFSDRYIPNTSENSFDVTTENFSVNIVDGLPEISFDTNIDYEYKIYRRDMFSNCKLINEISRNFEKEYVFIDDSVSDGDSYEYYVIPYFCGYKGKIEGKSTEYLNVTVPFMF